MTDATPALTVDDVRASMRTALKSAMRDRDQRAVAALRSGISAIDNAEAVPTEPTSMSGEDSPIAGAAIGLGTTEAARRELTVDAVLDLLRAEIDERREAATEIEAAGRADVAADLRQEADVLDAIIGKHRS